jgi:hypothetical protein
MEQIPIQEYRRVMDGIRLQRELEQAIHLHEVRKLDSQLKEIVRLCEPFIRFEVGANQYGQAVQAVAWVANSLRQTEQARKTLESHLTNLRRNRKDRKTSKKKG